MKLAVRQRDRRALMLLGAAVLIYTLSDWIILPAYDRIMAGPEIAAEKEQHLRRYRRAQARKGQYESLLKTADQSLSASESVLIAAANISVASSEVQSLVENAGSKVGLAIGQRMIGTPRRVNNDYAEIPMTLLFESTPGQLVSFLNELRSLPRLVTVRNLQVSPIVQLNEVPKGIDVTKNVRVNMTLAAFTEADLVKPEGGKR